MVDLHQRNDNAMATIVEATEILCCRARALDMKGVRELQA